MYHQSMYVLYAPSKKVFFEEGIKPMVVKKIMLKRRYNDDFTSIIYYIIGITTEQLKKTSQQNWVFATRNIRII